MPTPEEHIQHYIQLRDACSEIRRDADKKIAELKEVMARIENGFATNVLKDGMSSFGTESGRVHMEVRNKYQVRDREAFQEFIIADAASRLELIELRPVQKNCRVYVEEYDDVPDGVGVIAEQKVIITRK